MYVQDVLRENGAELYRQITESEAHIYVCGDISMASQVNSTVEEIVQNFGDKSIKEAQSIVLHLRDVNRYHEDIFGTTLHTQPVIAKQNKSQTQPEVIPPDENSNNNNDDNDNNDTREATLPRPHGAK